MVTERRRLRFSRLEMEQELGEDRIAIKLIISFDDGQVESIELPIHEIRIAPEAARLLAGGEQLGSGRLVYMEAC